MKAKVCQSRKSTHSIMNNSGYGLVSITRGEHTVDVPPSWLFTDGRLKKYAIERVNKMFNSFEKERKAC